MGPIERTLRAWPSTDDRELFDWLWSRSVSSEAFAVVMLTRPDDRMNDTDYLRERLLPDIVSEAIEAAEALGL